MPLWWLRVSFTELHRMSRSTWAQTPAAALRMAARQPRRRGCHRRGAGAKLRLVRRAASRTRSDDAGRGRRGSARLEPALAALNSGADGYVVAGPSLEADLPRTVAAAIERERSRRQLLTQKLAELEAEREQAEQQLARVEEAAHGTMPNRSAARRRSGPALGVPGARDQDLHWRCSSGSSSSSMRSGRPTSGGRQRPSLSPTSSRSGTRSSRRAWRRPRGRVTRSPLN